MKHRILPFLLAVLAGAAVLTACAQDKKAATADEVVNRVYPEGEGKYYQPPAETAAAESTKETVAGTTDDSGNKKAESKRKALEKKKQTEPTTIAVTVPSDNITSDNINPNISGIQSRVLAQMKARTLKSISLSEKSLTLETGQSSELKISFDPADALGKSCTVKSSTDCVNASVSESTVKVTAKKPGASIITVTSYNGHKATCNITVNKPAEKKDKVITDDTALSHSELCTAANVSRWLGAVINRLQSLGMTRNTSLSGGGTELKTADLPDKISYNAAQKTLADKAESELKTQTAEQWNNYEFNCVSEARDNGEYAFVITINQKEEPSE